MKQLGMSDSAIARRLGVTDKTVAKAVAWFQHMEQRYNGE
jgi:DNA-binding NarL/FixJ family response regulator